MTIRLLTGDCRDLLPTLPDASVHMVCTSPPYYALRSYLDGSHPDKHRELGSEPTPDDWLANMVAVFREVRRVLRPDGTCWVNIGDLYDSGTSSARKATRTAEHGYWQSDSISQRVTSSTTKPKDLLLMPARLALALQADGWFIRSQMPWVKRSCMPESATDRPTSAIEYVYMLTKSPRYFWDQEAVKRSSSSAPHAPGNKTVTQPKAKGNRDPAYDPDRVWSDGTRNFRNSDLFFDSLEAPYGMICGADGVPLAMDVSPAAFTGAHFATFPPKLIEPLIRGATSERGCCVACGAPWVRVTKRSFVPQGDVSLERGVRLETQHDAANQWAGTPRGTTSITTTGWRASCKCRELRCTVCSAVLDSAYANTKHTVPDMRQSVQTAGEHAPNEVLQPQVLQGIDAAQNREAIGREVVQDLRRDIPALDSKGGLLQPSLLRTAGEEAEANTLPSMWEDIHPASSTTEEMLGAMRSEMDSAEPGFHEGLDHHQHRLQVSSEERPPEREHLRLRAGASVGDGEEAGQASDPKRGGPPQERGPAGQSDRQPGANGKARTRRPSKADLLCDVPLLQDGVPSERQCPHCGSHAEWTAPPPTPCVVLDCFLGSGTTALVADRLQRHAIGIDLSLTYAEMAQRRIADDCPLFTSLAPAEVERMADLFDLAAD